MFKFNLSHLPNRLCSSHPLHSLRERLTLLLKRAQAVAAAQVQEAANAAKRAGAMEEEEETAPSAPAKKGGKKGKKAGQQQPQKQQARVAPVASAARQPAGDDEPVSVPGSSVASNGSRRGSSSGPRSLPP